MSIYRILYADNDPSSLKIVSEYLKGLGYIVELAQDPERAVDQLRNSLFDLAILDLRLVDNDDLNDKSGLEIAKAEARSTPKLIYTAFPSVAGAKEALVMDTHELPPAVDYLDKAGGLPGLKDAIEKTLAKYISPQANLALVWAAPDLVSVGQLATRLDPNQEISDFLQATREIEMIIRQLFAQYEQVTLLRLLWWKDSRGCLALYAYHHDVEDQYLITLGPKELIHKEAELFRSTISQTRSDHSPLLVNQKESLHFGAILWTVKGLNIDRMRSVVDLLQNGTEKQIQTLVNRLFASVQAIWHPQGRGGKRNKGMTTAAFGENVGFDPSRVSRSSLQEKFNAVADAVFARNLFPLRTTPTRIEINLPGGKTESLPNPLEFIYKELEIPFVAGPTTTTAGLTNLHAMLVDEDEQIWLTDYASMESSVVYRDFAEFETVVRFGIWEPTDILTALDFEEQLLKASSLAENISGRNVLPAYRNLLQTIVTTRNSAAKLVGDRMAVYYLTLLYTTAKAWLDLPLGQRLPRSQLLSYAYRLLYMAKIAQYLNTNLGNGKLASASKEADSHVLKLDEQQRRVWVGKSERQLSHTEFDLLLFLYQKKGGICRREEILEMVLNYKGGLDKSAKSLINTHINRLRRQIEPNPEKPIFVLTVRNEGYRLELAG